jgi:hypothetical protein
MKTYERKTAYKRNRVEMWRPFHAWTKGSKKDVPVLGLTEGEALLIQGVLNSMLQEKGALALQISRAMNVLKKRNLKPLDSEEKGALYHRNSDGRMLEIEE